MDVKYKGGKKSQEWPLGLTPEQLAKQKDHLLEWEYWSHKRLGDETQDFSFTVFKESLQFIVQEKLQWSQKNHELES